MTARDPPARSESTGLADPELTAVIWEKILKWLDSHETAVHARLDEREEFKYRLRPRLRPLHSDLQADMTSANLASSILDFYFDTRRRCLNEAKLLLIGQGGVGKPRWLRD